MRIAFLAWHGSIHTRRWAGWFAERGHEVHVVTCGGADVRDVDADGVPLPLRYVVHELGAPRAGKIGYLARTAAARHAVRRIAPDVLHAHWLTSYGLLALACDRKNLPLVVTAHGDDVLIAPKKAVMRRLVRRVLRVADLITVPGYPMREAVEKILLPHTPPPPGVAVFQYGVECSRLSTAGRELRAQRRDRAVESAHLVSARALLDLYRIDVLLEACSLLARDGMDIHLDLLGDGPKRDQLEQQAKQLGIADVCTFHGLVEPAKVEQFVGMSDAYVSISESDGVSLALLEALALGAVPVLSNIAANRPWVNDNATGALVQITPESVADGIKRALSLERERVAADNLAVVAERADRDTNLAACELLIDSLVGVSWDARPVGDDEQNASAA